MASRETFASLIEGRYMAAIDKLARIDVGDREHGPQEGGAKVREFWLAEADVNRLLLIEMRNRKPGKVRLAQKHFLRDPRTVVDELVEDMWPAKSTPSAPNGGETPGGSRG